MKPIHTQRSLLQPYPPKGPPAPAAAAAEGQLRDATGARGSRPQGTSAATIVMVNLQQQIFQTWPGGN